MADIMNEVGIEFKTGSKNINSSVDKIINDLSKLNASIRSTSRFTTDLRDKLGKLDVNLDGSKLKSTLNSLDSTTLKYNTTSGQTVTVTKKVRGNMDDLKVSVRNVNNEIDKSESIWKRLTSGFSKVSKELLGVFGISKGAMTLKDATKSATQYEEALNLFTVTMGSQAQEAMEWVQKFSNALYIDDSGLMQYMGSLNSLISGLGVATDKSYKMSKNLTQLVYDLASFKNLDIETSFRKIQSAMSGEIEPLRNVGVALSQNTLQELANSLGIDQRVASMSEAEKAQLRYIQILKSTTEWQGDMARTLISPANALRVLQQQFTLLGRAIGRVFIPFVMKAIPYVMALTQILTDLANKLANFFGYKLTDIDYSSLGDASALIGDIGDEAEDTTKKLNTMLAPFDELNVVQNENKNKGDLGSLGGDLGVDLPEYDALAGLTDQLSKNVGKARENLEKFFDIAKKVGIVLGTLWTINKLSKFINYLSHLKNTFSKLKPMVTKMSDVFKTLVTRFKDGYDYSKFFGEKGLTSILAGTRNLLTPLEKLGLTIAGTVISFKTAFSNMKDFALGTESLNSSLTKTIATTGLATTAVFLFGSPVGAAITLLGGLTGALLGYEQGLYELKVHNAVFDDQGVHIQALSNHMTNLFENSTKYISSMDGLSTKYTDAKSIMDDARNSLDLFIESLGLQDDEITSSQLDELKNKYTLLKEETNATHKASDDYYIGLIKSSGEARNKTEEDIAKQIADYKALSSAASGYAQEYMDKEEELTLARYTGKLTTDEYNKAIQELKVQYGYTSSFAFDATGAIDNFAKSLTDINYSSVEELNDNIKKTQEEYNNTIKDLEKYKENLSTTNKEANEGYLTQIENLEAVKRTTGSLSTEQETMLTTLKGLVESNNKTTEESIKNVDNTITEIQGNYKGYLATIYADLSSKGAETSTEFKGTIKTIKGELTTLKNVDMSGTGLAWYKSMESSILGSGNDSMITKTRDAMKKVGVAGSDTLIEYLTPTEKARKGLYKSFEEVAAEINKGTASGIDKNVNIPNKSIKDTSNLLEKTFREQNGIHSPSTLYSGFGKNIVEGIAKGIADNDTLVSSKLASLSKKMSDTMKNVNLSLNSDSFKNGLNDLLSKLQMFTDRFRNSVNSLLSGFTTSMNGIRVVNEKLYYTQMPRVSVPQFATGGFPKTGEFFMAREDGPEMIGKIGNRTAVANNDQITTSITNAIVEAFSGINFGGGAGTTVVNIGGRKVFEGIGEYISSENDRYGTNYVSV